LNRYIFDLWIFLPSYFANMAPVVISSLLKNRRPLDLGRKFIDGKRVLGDNKTFEGLIFSLAIGITVGLVQGRVRDGVLLSIGANVGDLVGSFMKRRLNISSGMSLPIIDQEGFLVASMIFISGRYNFSVDEIVFLLSFTFIAHVVANVIAYILHLKPVPY